MKRYSALCGGLTALLITAITALAFAFGGGRSVSADEVGGGGDLVPGIVAQQNGDTNADGARDLSDVVYTLSFLFLGGPRPKPLSCEPNVIAHNGDVDADGQVDIGDAIYTLEWLYHGGTPPREACLFGG